NTLQIATDWLSVGLDPAKSTLFIQSSVLEHAELHLLLSMITPLSWLERVPTYKEQIENLKDRDLGTYGFLGYPLLQSADIVMYGDPKHDLVVPVGEDQVPHIELTREVVRRFNGHFGIDVRDLMFEQQYWLTQDIILYFKSTVPALPAAYWADPPQSEDGRRLKIKRAIRAQVFDEGLENYRNRLPPEIAKFVRLDPVLREPDYVLTETPRLPGTDGRRMAKSYGNAIWLSDSPDEIRTKVRNMMTDPQRQRRTDPGRPEVCPVFAWHKLFSPRETIAQVDRDCRTAAIGCVDCKKLMAENLVKWIEPIQARRKELEADPQQVWDILDAGGKKAQSTARRTMKRVRNAIFKWDDARKLPTAP
ncbi:MAG: tryptophan--tRNA ligase, partial [Candidatus Acidiferrales bacterium]